VKAKRLQGILKYINDNNTVSLSELCKEFKASPATMRRDLQELENNAQIERIRGGAKSLITRQKYEPPFTQRQNMNLAEKQRIAQYAFSLINDNDAIILDSSTTVCELAKLLAVSDKDVTVITNDAMIAFIIAPHPEIELIFVGGYIRPGFFTSMGMFAESMWKQLHADKLFLGVDAIHPVDGILNYRTEEISCKRLMLNSSKRSIVLCDHTKFSSTAVLQISPLHRIDEVITGVELEDKYIEPFIDTGLRITRV
jgi:DeoR/GlpR family transcriptional regulator of sugar metabolism